MSTTVTTNNLPSNVPKLEVTGKNWAIYRIRFTRAVQSKGVWGHLDGSLPCPVTPTVQPATGDEVGEGQGNAIPVSVELTTWKKDEALALDLLTQRIPDSTVIRTASQPNAAAVWAEIVREYTEKGAYAQTDLRTKFLESKCPDKGDVRAWLDSLRVQKEELAQVGVEIDEKDYRSTIISSLPVYLSSFASSQLAAARLYSPTKTIDPDILISLISEEYERQRTSRARRITPSTTKSRDPDEAMAVNPSTKRKHGTSERKPRVCWNCGETGHFRHQCPKPKKIKTTNGSESAHAAENSDDEAFGVTDTDSMPDLELVSNSSDSSESIPDLHTVSNSSDGDSVDGHGNSYMEEDDDGEDWFSEVGEDLDSPWGDGWDTEELSGVDSDGSSLFYVDPDSVSGAPRDGICDAPNISEPEDAAAYVSAGAAHTNSTRTELYDSGTTRHISPYRDMFETFAEIPPKAFNTANQQKFDAIGKGEMVIEVPNGMDASKLTLTEVLYSPEVGYTLVSIGRLDECGYSATFEGGQCTIRGDNGETIGHIPKSGKGLYKVVHEDGESSFAATEKLTVMELHRRMGHISPGIAKKLVKNGLVTGIRIDDSSNGVVFCESCVYAKATRKPVAKEREGERATEFGGEVHTDLWGPAPVATIRGRRYYVTFTDDKTRMTYLHLLKRKSDTLAAYKDFEAECLTQHKARIKVLHSDRGGEYMGKEFVLHLKKNGTKQKLTIHDTPQHNGVAERLNRTILEKVRAMLHASGQPKFLWGEAARHAVWLKNRTSTKALDGMTPFEALTGDKPSLRGLREWGSRVWVRNEKKAKLGGRVDEGVWVGIDEKSKGFRVYWPKKCTVTVERNVYFNEQEAPPDRLEGEDYEIVEAPTATHDVSSVSAQGLSNNTQNNHTNEASVDIGPRIPTPETPDPNNIPHERRTRKPSQRVQDLIDGRAVHSNRRNDPVLARGIQAPTEPIAERIEFEGEGSAEQIMALMDEELAMVLEMSEAEGLDPSSLADAMRRPDWLDWEKAIHEELTVLQDAKTWVLVDPPPGANIVSSKWVFRVKKDADGNIARKKARLVAQGFSQVPGVDYFDTYAPVARLATIRTVLALAARYDMELHQIDIKGAYLNGELTDDEVIYMRQPPGFASREHPNRVCRLHKTLYGLKQSGRRWYQKLVRILVNALGFIQVEVDQAVFFKQSGDKLTIIVVHVDDCTIAATTIELVVDLKMRLREHVEITDLGELHWLLGIEIHRDREARTISLSQRSYIESIVRRYGFEDLKPISTPMDPNVKLSTTQNPSTGAQYAAMRHIPYREAVGSSMYAMLGTRPDIAFANTVVSKFSGNPGMAHWEAVKRIYRYLIGTKDMWLTYGGEERVLVGYVDADGSMAEDRHAISGYAFLIDGGAVSWSSKRQEIVSLSTTESEYVAATHAAKEALWLRSLISQLFGNTAEATTIFSDNQSAIALTKDHQYHARTKHIDVRFHFIRWVVENGQLRLIYCPTADMVADTLTKALPSPKVKHFAAELGLCRA
jgi:Reverse transcriptase (RNA-dependent DNA polymerase)/gag-polypeptide of LTR copia-type/Integrase core domain/GAG-pre-integrase domain/Zinc knuckle